MYVRYHGPKVLKALADSTKKSCTTTTGPGSNKFKKISLGAAMLKKPKRSPMKFREIMSFDSNSAMYVVVCGITLYWKAYSSTTQYKYCLSQ
jgi:hypothetical protein